jgi:hypothetical protein
MLSELITNWSIYTNKVSGVYSLFDILVLCHCSRFSVPFPGYPLLCCKLQP